MHELGITRNLVALVAERAGRRRVRRVWLEIGAYAGLMPEAVRFCFDVAAHGTVLAGAALEIVELRPGLQCRGCRAAGGSGGPAGADPPVCARCGGVMRLCRGDEINISAMELETEMQPCA